MRHRNLHLPVEIQFLFDDAERAAGLLACDSPVENVIGDIFYGGGQLLRRNYFRNIRFLIHWIPPSVAPRERLLFFEREVFGSECFVVPERAELLGEVLAPLAVLLHMLDQFFPGVFILFLRVLLVQDAVLLLAHSCASKAVLASRAVAAIFKVGIIGRACRAKFQVVCIVPAGSALVHALGFITPRSIVHCGFCIEDACAVLAVFQVCAVYAVMCILRIEQVVPAAVLYLLHLDEAVWLCEGELQRFSPQRFHSSCCMKCHFLLFLRVLFFAELLIEKHVLLLAQVHASDAVAASDAVSHRKAIGTVEAVYAVAAAVALGAVYALVAEF